MKFTVLFLSLFWSGLAIAAELHPYYRPVRSMGMGGLTLTTVDGAEAVFLNPAAMQMVDTLDVHLLGLNLGGRVPSTEDMDAISGIDSSDPTTYNNLYGRKMHLEVNLRTAFATPYFGFGYFKDYGLNMELRNPSLPYFDAYLRNDEGYVVAAAIPFMDRSALGLSLKRLNRMGGDPQQLSLTDATGGLDAILDRFGNSGQAHALDVSYIMRARSPLNPTFSVALKDIGVTKFKKTAGARAPSSIDQNLMAGASLIVTNHIVDWTVGLEADHLLEPDIEIGKKIHVGTELSLPMLDIRAGFNQGYFSYGVGFDLYFMRIDAASYYEEMGVYPGQSAELRYLISLSVDLSFDGAFNIVDKNGKKLKLKQRR